jgi:hypothetical protein
VARAASDLREPTTDLHRDALHSAETAQGGALCPGSAYET